MSPISRLGRGVGLTRFASEGIYMKGCVVSGGHIVTRRHASSNFVSDLDLSINEKIAKYGSFYQLLPPTETERLIFSTLFF